MSHASQRDCSIAWHWSRLLSNRLSGLTIYIHHQYQQIDPLCKPTLVFLFLTALSPHGHMCLGLERAITAEMPNVETCAVMKR